MKHNCSSKPVLNPAVSLQAPCICLALITSMDKWMILVIGNAVRKRLEHVEYLCFTLVEAYFLAANASSLAYFHIAKPLSCQTHGSQRKILSKQWKHQEGSCKLSRFWKKGPVGAMDSD